MSADGFIVVVYLVYEDGATQASPPSLTRVVEGAVLSNYHHVNSDTVITSLFRSQSEVEAITSVVLHNEKDSRCPCVDSRVDWLYNKLNVFSYNVFFPQQDVIYNNDYSV